MPQPITIQVVFVKKPHKTKSLIKTNLVIQVLVGFVYSGNNSLVVEMLASFKAALIRKISITKSNFLLQYSLKVLLNN